MIRFAPILVLALVLTGCASDSAVTGTLANGYADLTAVAAPTALATYQTRTTSRLGIRLVAGATAGVFRLRIRGRTTVAR
jgi:hypothetical protein